MSAATDAADASGDAAPIRAPYDDIVAKHLRTFESSRLWVGEGLERANWGGLNKTFGPLLALHPNESIVAVYDDSAFGRGRAGFVVTDAAIYYVNTTIGGGTRGYFALADVTERNLRGVGTQVLTIPLRANQTAQLRVDEPDAHGAVAAFLQAVGQRNRHLVVSEAMEEVSLSGHRAIVRLETMAKHGNITAKHRDRLRALVAQLDADDARRAAERKAKKQTKGT